MTSSPRLAIVTVRYGDARPTMEFITHIRSQVVGESVPILVADNGPEESEDLKSLLAREVLQSVLTNTTNPGYYPSAFDVAASWSHAPDWIVVCNPDVRLDVAETLQVLARRPIRKMAIVAPQVLESPGWIQRNPDMKSRPSLFSVYLQAGIHHFVALHLAYLKLSEMRTRAGDPLRHRGGQAQRIYAGHGSVLAFSCTAFAAIQPYAYKAILYTEEVWVGELARLMQIPVEYDSDWKALHFAHSTTGLLPWTTKARYFRQASRQILTWRIRPWKLLGN